MNRISLVAAALLMFAPNLATAKTIDFEGILKTDQEVARVSNGTVFNDIMRVSSREKIRLVRAGGSKPTAFVSPAGADRPVPSNAFGDAFLTGAFKRKTDLKLRFLEDVRGLRFDIADIDGGADGINRNGKMNDRHTPRTREFFTFVARHEGTVVQKIKVDSSMVKGDGAVTSVIFKAGLFIDEVKIKGRTPSGKKRIGWGLDNIFFASTRTDTLTSSVPAPSVVPLPSSVGFLAAGLLAIGAMRQTRRRT